MRIAYISSPSFSDVDISMMSELQEQVELDYYLITYPAELRSAAINIKTAISVDGVLTADKIRDLDVVSRFLKKTNFYVVNSTKNRTLSWSRISASLKLFWRIWRGNYDVVHGTGIPGLTTLWMFLFRKKLVLTVHDPIPHSSFNSKSQLLERRLAMKLCRHFILLNKAQKKEFIGFYGINTRRQKIYSSKLGSYNYLQMYSLESQEGGYSNKYILFFGKIYSYKGLQHLMPAMLKVHERCPNLKLVVAGKGNFSFDITPYEKLPYIDIRNRFIPDDELAGLIENCEFVVVPYIDATQSGVVMSSYAFHKPCLVTNVGGLPEMVIDGKFGRVIPPADEEKLAKAICQMCSDRMQLQQFSRNIKSEYQEGDSSWKVIISGLVNIYKDVTVGK